MNTDNPKAVPRTTVNEADLVMIPASPSGCRPGLVHLLAPVRVVYLADRALSLGGGSKYLLIHGETPSHRLKPGLRTLPSTGAVPQGPCRQGSGDKRNHWTATPSHPWPISVVSVTPPILGRPSETEPFVLPPSLVSGALP